MILVPGVLCGGWSLGWDPSNLFLRTQPAAQWTHSATDRFPHMWYLNKGCICCGCSVRMWASKIFLSTVLSISFTLFETVSPLLTLSWPLFSVTVQYLLPHGTCGAGCEKKITLPFRTSVSSSVKRDCNFYSSFESNSKALPKSNAFLIFWHLTQPFQKALVVLSGIN